MRSEGTTDNVDVRVTAYPFGVGLLRRRCQMLPALPVCPFSSATTPTSLWPRNRSYRGVGLGWSDEAGGVLTETTPASLTKIVSGIVKEKFVVPVL